jgi:hypothetical protein
MLGEGQAVAEETIAAAVFTPLFPTEEKHPAQEKRPTRQRAGTQNVAAAIFIPLFPAEAGK